MQKANNIFELIFQNTKDIKELKDVIAGLYYCTENLGDEANAVLRENTNLPVGLTKAYIVDSEGNLYKLISYNEDATTIYIEYYTNIKGIQGDTGATGADGQNGANGFSFRLYNGLYISNSTSYQKSNLANADNLQVGDIVLFINGTIAPINTITTNTFKVTNNDNIEIQATTKGYFYAKSQPTTSGDYLIYAKTAIFNALETVVFSAGDMITYIDSNDVPTEIYEVVGYSGDNLIVELKGTFAKGKQLYQHNIYFTQRDNNYNDQIKANFTIINDDPTPLNTNELLVAYFRDKFGNTQEDPTKTIMASGTFWNSGTRYQIRGVGLGSTYMDETSFGFSTDAYSGNTFANRSPLSAYAKSLVDNVVEL